MSLFLFLFGISLGQYCWKSLAKSGGFRKILKSRHGHKGRELSIEEGFKPSAHHDIERLKGGDLGTLNYWAGQNWRGNLI